jgi:hypothetical protein
MLVRNALFKIAEGGPAGLAVPFVRGGAYGLGRARRPAPLARTAVADGRVIRRQLGGRKHTRQPNAGAEPGRDEQPVPPDESQARRLR